MQYAIMVCAALFALCVAAFGFWFALQPLTVALR
jgi:hypothetical protein